MTRPFRLSAPKPSEQDRLGQIVDYLRHEQARGRVAWFARINGGGMFDRTGRFLRFYWLYLSGKKPAGKGKADLEGQLPDGRYFALEVKKPGEKPTPEQVKFLTMVRDNNGLSAVIVDYNEARMALFGEDHEKPRSV